MVNLSDSFFLSHANITLKLTKCRRLIYREESNLHINNTEQETRHVPSIHGVKKKKKGSLEIFP